MFGDTAEHLLDGDAHRSILDVPGTGRDIPVSCGRAAQFVYVCHYNQNPGVSDDMGDIRASNRG